MTPFTFLSFFQVYGLGCCKKRRFRGEGKERKKEKTQKKGRKERKKVKEDAKQSISTSRNNYDFPSCVSYRVCMVGCTCIYTLTHSLRVSS